MKLRELLLTDPEAFMRKYRLEQRSIDRYASKLRTGKLTPELQEKYTDLLDKHQGKKELMEECLKQSLYGRKQ